MFLNHFNAFLKFEPLNAGFLKFPEISASFLIRAFLINGYCVYSNQRGQIMPPTLLPAPPGFKKLSTSLVSKRPVHSQVSDPESLNRHGLICNVLQMSLLRFILLLVSK